MGWEQFHSQGESEAHLLREIHEQGPSAKTGRPAKYPIGVNYVGAWETLHDGVGVAVRKHACALRAAKLPVFLQSESHTHSNMGILTTVEYSNLPKAIIDQVDHITHLDHADTAVVVRHTVPTQSMLESIAFPGGSQYMTGSAIELHRQRTILYAAFEENVIPPERVRVLNTLGGIWTPSRAAKRWLEDCGVSIQIRIIPHPFVEDDPMALVKRKRKGKTFRFLNISKWEPRKAQHDLIGGFLLAFSPDDPVELVLKCQPFTRCADYPKNWAESIREWLRIDEVKNKGWCGANVQLKLRVIWNTIVSREDLAKMYAESDAYVSCGRSEGFDLPSFDAKLAGRRLVHADNGAAWDYRRDTDILINSCGQEKFHPWYGFKHATWPDFDARDVSEALLKAFKAETEVQGLDRQMFSMDYVGTLMRNACVEIAPELSEVYQ